MFNNQNDSFYNQVIKTDQADATSVLATGTPVSAAIPQGKELHPDSDFPNCFIQVDKRDLLARLDAAGVPAVMPRQEGLQRFEFLRQIHARVPFAADGTLHELHNETDSLNLPEELGIFPVWFIQLPSSWQQHLEELASAESFGDFCGPSPYPWLKQSFLWIPMSAKVAGTEWGHAGLHIPRQVYPGEAENRAYQPMGVLLVFQCHDRFAVTMFPVDDLLCVSLQAADQQSTRYYDPNATTKDLQHRTRIWEEIGQDPDYQLAADELVLTPVWMEDRTGHAVKRQFSRGCGRLDISHCPYSAGVGILPTIVNAVPAALQHDQRIWLRATVPWDAYETLESGFCETEIHRPLSQKDGGSLFVLTIRWENYLVAVAIHQSDRALAIALDIWAATGKCPLAIENYQSGRLFPMEVAWPKDCTGTGAKPCASVETLSEMELALPDGSIYELVRQIADTTGTSPICFLCTARDAGTWQLEQVQGDRLGFSADRVGEVGALSIPVPADEVAS